MTNGLKNYEAGEYEASQFKAAIEAAVKAGVQHIIQSTLDNAEVAPHMSYKAKGACAPASEASRPAERVTHVQSCSGRTSLYTSHYIFNLS